MAPHMHLGVSAISTQGRIQGGAKINRDFFFRPEGYSNKLNV